MRELECKTAANDPAHQAMGSGGHYNKITVEYALRDLRKPIGVAEWRTWLVGWLPKRLQGKLPTIEQIEKELRNA